MRTAVALGTTSLATFLFMVAVVYVRKSNRLELENGVLWDQVRRFEAYFQERAAEDELRSRAAIRN